jgi:hypothetical protein
LPNAQSCRVRYCGPRMPTATVRAIVRMPPTSALHAKPPA